jgi:predicted GTPase
VVAEARQPRAIAFVDGQHLFHQAREAFGYQTPNYDVVALSEAVCRS